MCLLLADVREQGELARTLHRDCDLALVAPARAADAPRADLALLGDVAPQLVDVLVVDLVDLRLAEEAGLTAPRPARRGALPAPSLAAIRFRCWQILLLRTECRRPSRGSRRRSRPSRLRGRTGSRRRRPRRRGCRGTALTAPRPRPSSASSRPAPPMTTNQAVRRRRSAGPSRGGWRACRPV